MAGENTLSLREAGDRLSNLGVTDDVTRSDPRKVTQRQPSEELDEQSDEELDEETTAAEDDAPIGDAEEPEAEADETTDHDAETDDAEVKKKTNPLDAEYDVKINGETKKVPLKEIIQGYQRTEDYHHKTQALAENRRDLMAAHSKVAENYAARLEQAGGIVLAVRKLLIGDINSQYMQQLRSENPHEWTVQRQVQQDRIDQIDGVLRQVQQEHERHAQGVEAQRTQDRAQLVSNELEAVRKHIPDWDAKGKGRLSEYLAKTGFQPSELQGIYDSRVLIVAEKARLYDALQAQKKAPMQKQTKPLPKTVKTGTGSIQSAAKQPNKSAQKFQELKKRAKTTGSMRDAGKAIASLLD